MVHELLSGTYDLHIHTAPDVIPRKCTDEETVRRLEAAGMKGCAIKCHYFETAARAALLQERFPQMIIVGGLVLNRSVGGINPEAVERFGQMGGRMLWSGRETVGGDRQGAGDRSPLSADAGDRTPERRRRACSAERRQTSRNRTDDGNPCGTSGAELQYRTAERSRRNGGND